MAVAYMYIIIYEYKKDSVVEPSITSDETRYFVELREFDMPIWISVAYEKSLLGANFIR